MKKWGEYFLDVFPQQHWSMATVYNLLEGETMARSSGSCQMLAGLNKSLSSSLITDPKSSVRSPNKISNHTLCDSPALHLRTLTPTHTTQHLQRHPVWQPSNDTLCDSPVLHLRTLTPNTHTPQHLQRHPVWHWPLHIPHNTSNNTLSHSPVLHLRTLTPTHTTQHLQRHPVTARSYICEPTQHLQRHPVWQPGLTSANPDTCTHSAQRLQRHPVWQPPPPPQPIHKICEPSPTNLKSEPL